MSAFGAMLERMGVPVVSLSVLLVPEVLRGEVWRLLTWAPLELSPLGLIFGCLLLYFLGPDLLRHWGMRRFFALFFGGAAVVGGVTCLIGRFVWARVAAVPHFGLWPMEEAMIIAWASLFRDRQILVMFALPMAGRNLIWLTIALTVVMAALSGFPLVRPPLRGRGRRPRVHGRHPRSAAGSPGPGWPGSSAATSGGPRSSPASTATEPPRWTH